jgi:hypothetical protein
LPVGNAQDRSPAPLHHVGRTVLAQLGDQVVESLHHRRLGLILLRLFLRLLAHLVESRLFRREFRFLLLDQVLARLQLRLGFRHAGLELVLL